MHCLIVLGVGLVVLLGCANTKQLFRPPSGRLAFPKPAASTLAPGGAVGVLHQTTARFLYLGSVPVMIGICVGIYWRRGALVVVSVLCYFLALSTMTVAMRNIFVNQVFKYPKWVTASHFLGTGTVGSSIMLYRRMVGASPPGTSLSFRQFMSRVVPVGVAYTTSLGFANTGLMYTNAHFYEMVGSTTPLATAALTLVLRKPFDLTLLQPLLLVMLGLVLCASGELVFSALGFTCCACGVLARAAKVTLQQVLMDSSAMQQDPLAILVWTSVPCFTIMASWSLFAEGTRPFVEVSQPGTTGALLATVANALVLQLASLYVLRELGAVAQQLAGELKGALSSVAGVAAFGEAIMPQQVVGYACALSGIYWYNRMDMAIKAARKAATAADAAVDATATVDVAADADTATTADTAATASPPAAAEPPSAGSPCT